MEEVFLRFPHVGEQIFEQMDNKDLKKCTEAGKHWNGFISGQKIPWIRMIHKYVNCSDPWPYFFKKSNLETIKIIAKTMLKYDPGHFPKRGNPLGFAAKSGNIGIVTELLKTHSGDQTKDEYGKTPLHRAASNGDLEMCRMFVEKFKDVNPKDKQDNTPLHEAAKFGHLHLCKFIVGCIKESNPKGFMLEIDDHERTPFHIAAKNGHLEICKFLIDNAIEKNPVFKQGATLLHDMASLPNLEACQLIIERIEDILPRDHDNDTPLHNAAYSQNSEMCKLIIDSLPDKNPIMNSINGKTLLHEMVKTDALLVPFQMILERANNKNPKDLEGKTPLHAAANWGNYDAFESIFEIIDDKNPKDSEGDTPLHIAAMEGHLQICKLIITNVSDKNPKNNLKITPLHDAAERNQHEVCKLITKNIKDIHEKNHDGKTPYDMAKEKGNHDIMELLGYPFERINNADLKKCPESSKHWMDCLRGKGPLFTSIPESEITQPHLPPGFWGIENPLKSLSRKPPTP